MFELNKSKNEAYTNLQDAPKAESKVKFIRLNAYIRSKRNDVNQLPKFSP